MSTHLRGPWSQEGSADGEQEEEEEEEEKGAVAVRLAVSWYAPLDDSAVMDEESATFKCNTACLAAGQMDKNSRRNPRDVAYLWVIGEKKSI